MCASSCGNVMVNIVVTYCIGNGYPLCILNIYLRHSNMALIWLSSVLLFSDLQFKMTVFLSLMIHFGDAVTSYIYRFLSLLSKYNAFVYLH